MDYIFIYLISFLAAALTLFSGFGLGTLLIPAFSIFFPIEIAIAATALVHLANNILKFFLVGRMAHVQVTLKFAIPAAFTAAFGAWLLSQIGSLPEIATYQLFDYWFYIEPIKLIIGIVMVIFLTFELIPSLQVFSFSAKHIPIGGAISGFFGGFSGFQGPVRSMFLIKAGLTKNEFIGTTVVSSIIVDISRLFIYGTAIFGLHLAELKAQGIIEPVVISGIAAFAGSLVGVMLLNKISFETIHKIIGFFLFSVAVGLIAGLI